MAVAFDLFSLGNLRLCGFANVVVAMFHYIHVYVMLHNYCDQHVRI